MRYFKHLLLAGCCAISVVMSVGAAPQPQQSRSLVVLDKGCSKLVQPYDMAGTIGTTIKDTGASLAKKTGDKLKIWLGSGGKKSDAAAQKAELSQGFDEEARAAAKRGNWLPQQTEVAFGERAHAQETNLLERDSKIGLKVYPIADALLDDILGKLGESAPYKFQLFILKNSTRNALARPGGFLYLDYGLLSDPALLPKARFALAHEVAHVLQRHETRELQALIVDSFDSLAQLEQAKSDPNALLANLKIGKDTYILHHVDQELQADSCAARMLHKAYPDLQVLAESVNTFLADLAAAEAAAAKLPAAEPVAPASPGEAMPEMAQTAKALVTSGGPGHPTSQQRAQNLRTIHDEIVKAQSQG